MRQVRFGLLIAAGLALANFAARAATLIVDGNDVPAPGAQFTHIQDALSAAQDGDEIVVRPARYFEKINFAGKNVHLRSVSPLDNATVQATIIDAQFFDSVVKFAGTETASCTLEGFTITKGLADAGAGVFGGGSQGAQAVIRNNIITNCHANFWGGGLYNCNGVVQNNEISNNTASLGGGLFQCAADVDSNLISNNVALTEGGGLESCGGAIRKNLIQNNQAPVGGGIARGGSVIELNFITGNTATQGGGLAFITNPIVNNTISGNHAGSQGGGLFSCPAMITSNTVAQNTAPIGGGLFGCSGLIGGNLIEDNAAQHGGGLAQCDGALDGNQIESNTAKLEGGGLSACRAAIVRNTMRLNQAQTGGAMAGCIGTIDGNRIQGNSAALGGGMSACGNRIQNNLIQGNTAPQGAGIESCYGVMLNNTFDRNGALGGGGESILLTIGVTFRNNIVSAPGSLALRADFALAPDSRLLIDHDCFGARMALLVDAAGTTVTSISELQNSAPWASLNIDADPEFISPLGPDGQLGAWDDNDLHLAPGSPCIDAGTPHVLAALPVWDQDGLCRWIGQAVDLGCYEFGAGLDTDGDGLSDQLEAQVGSDPQLLDTDGDGLSDAFELARGFSPTHPDAPQGLTVPLDAPTIQEAIMRAVNGETIVLQTGNYLEALIVQGKPLTLTSQAPSNPLSIARTVIDALNQDCVIQLQDLRGVAFTIQGLTLTGGFADHGAAVLGGGALLTLTNCNIHNNLTQLGGTVENARGEFSKLTMTSNQASQGGALLQCDGPIHDCLFRLNSATFNGGALYLCPGVVMNNTFTSNTTIGRGGALSTCDGPVLNNTFTGNHGGSGGAIHASTSSIVSNVFTGNTAGSGGALNQCNQAIVSNTFIANVADFGGALNACNGTVTGNTISGNTGHVNGGGLYNCGAAITTNTIVNNFGFTGGAFAQCFGPVQQNLIRANRAGFAGGAFASCSGAVSDNTITSNTAGQGGAFFQCFGPITDNVITSNTARSEGGGLMQCPVLVDGNRFESNSALQGGAIAECDDVISHNRIVGNRASQGAGLYLCGGVVAENLIIGNSADQGSAAHDCGAAFFDNTIAINRLTAGSAEPGAGGLFNSYGDLFNNIFYRNDGFALQTDDVTTKPLSIHHNLFFGQPGGDALIAEVFYPTATEINGALGVYHDNLEADPGFVSPAGADGNLLTAVDNDYHLRSDSPAIDAGAPLGDPQETDLDGNPRPLEALGDGNLAIDIGAFEFFGLRLTAPSQNVVLRAGDTVRVAWQSNLLTAGAALRFELWLGGSPIAGLGIASDPAGAGETLLTIPAAAAGGPYTIRAFSQSDSRLSATAPGFIFVSRALNSAGGWTAYR